ncbi:MAG: PD40 domain-containing protein, partial [Rhodoferax sp.]|nr:PD40 domain-containing protein [Actinomycetota bacterium]
QRAATAAWRTRPRRLVWVLPALALAGGALLLTLVVVPSVLTAPPAVAPTGPGALPERLFVPPLWTAMVSQRPVARAAYVVATRGEESVGSAAFVVSADGGSYRRLPWRARDHGLSLSPDGRRVAWVSEEPIETGPNTANHVVVLTLATGSLSTAASVPTNAQGAQWSPDGRSLAVWGTDYAHPGDSSGVVNVYVLDALTLRSRLVGSGVGPVGFSGGRPVVSTVGDLGNGLVLQPRLVVSPDGGTAFGIAQVGETGVPQLRRGPVFPSRPDLPEGPVVDVGQLPGASSAEVLAWVRQGVVVVAYARGSARGPAEVALLDPVTGRTARVLTALPGASTPGADGVSPQVLAVAADVVAGGRTEPTPAPTFGLLSVPRLRWLAGQALAPLLILVGLGATALLLSLLWRRPSRSRSGP